MSEEDIKRLVDVLTSRLQWGATSDWKTDDFEKLREQIKESTGVYLSVTTLKRLVGKVDYQGTPTITTLNTVSQYLGYEGWRDFQNKETKVSQEKTVTAKPTQRPQSARLFFAAGALVTILIILVFSFTDLAEGKVDPDQVSFTIKKVTKGIPNSVIFEYDVSRVKARRVEIQQDWDPTKRHNVDPAKKIFTHFYDFPGYYNAKLVVNGEVIHRRDLYIASEGWLAALSYENDPPRYLLAPEWSSVGQLRINDQLKREVELEEDKSVLSYYYAIDDPQEDFRDFHLESKLRFTTQSGKYACEYRRIVILGTKMSMRVPISAKGCVAENELRLGSLFIDGTTNDLSGFGVENGALVSVEIKNENNILSVSFDGILAFQQPLADDFGKLAGVHMAFHGVGEVEALSLTTPNSTIVAL